MFRAITFVNLFPGAVGASTKRKAGRPTRETRWYRSAHIRATALDEDQLPFGGVKQSGLGKEHGDEAIEHYTDSKSVVIATETHSEIIGGE